MAGPSDAVAWVIRELRYERWLASLEAETADRGEDEPVEEARRPA